MFKRRKRPTHAAACFPSANDRVVSINWGSILGPLIFGNSPIAIVKNSEESQGKLFDGGVSCGAAAATQPKCQQLEPGLQIVEGFQEPQSVLLAEVPRP